jgi:flagellar motor switch protein FliG
MTAASSQTENLSKSTLSKPTQAVLLVLSIDEETVAKVLRHMDPEDIRLLRDLAGKEYKASSTDLAITYRTFLNDARVPVLPSGAGTAYIEKLAQRSLGSEKSKSLFKESNHESPHASIERRSPGEVASVLEGENPQVIAAILAELTPEFSSNIINLFEKDLQAKVLNKLASLEAIPAATVTALCNAVEEQLSKVESGSQIRIDGVTRVANILSLMPQDETEDLLVNMGEEDPGMVFKLRRAMFGFEDLLNVQGRGMQAIIKEISNDQLVLALKTASDPLKDKILSSVSRRAAEILMDDLMAMGPVKLSEVEKAQQEIVDTALRLESEGKIVVAGRGGEELV